MTYTFTKIIQNHKQVPYGNLACKIRYDVFSEEGLLGQYFKGYKNDYFIFYDELTVVVKVTFDDIIKKGEIIDAFTNEPKAFYHFLNVINEEAFATITIANIHYNCINVTPPINNKETSILITNNTEQFFYKFTVQRKKQTAETMEELSGSIEASNDDLYIVFIGIALLEEFLFL